MMDDMLDTAIFYYAQDRFLLAPDDAGKAAGTPAPKRPEHNPGKHTTPSVTFPPPKEAQRRVIDRLCQWHYRALMANQLKQAALLEDCVRLVKKGA